ITTAKSGGLGMTIKIPDDLSRRANIQNKRILSRSPWDRVCVCSISETNLFWKLCWIWCA
ncbi:hypothetical protein XV90_02205, partial [Vibrio cholerae]